MNILIYGKGVTGKALQQWLSVNNNVTVIDDNDYDESILMSDIDYCVVSPGIPPTAKLMTQLKQYNIKLISELQLCSNVCKAKLISVTGTNGKTTITQMIHHILTKCGSDSYLLGNGGVPFSTCAERLASNSIAVLESSSFQLVGVESFAPYISITANIDIDHLDYHKSIDNYIRAKSNNFLHQNTGQVAIFNLDDDTCCQVSKNCKAKKIFYSVSSKCDCYIANDKIIVNNGKLSSCEVGMVKSMTHYNMSNALASIIAVTQLGISATDAVIALEDYIVDAHKNQLVCTYNNIRFINDSKATNIHATISAINCYKDDIALIVGGYDKGYAFDSLFLQDKVVFMAIIGQTADKLARCCQQYNVPYKQCLDMYDAVESCYEYLSCGVVLLSPCCSSYDMYDNYLQRGEHFVECVRQICK